MKYLAALLLALSLVGCATAPQKEPPVVVKQEYILRIPPAESLKIPAEVPPLDLDKAKQSDVARWIAANIERMDQMERQLIEIGKFLSDEQKKLNSK